MNLSRYSKKLINNSYYGTLGVGSTNSKRMSVIKRRNKLRKIYNLDSEIEDESQGYVYMPHTTAADIDL